MPEIGYEVHKKSNVNGLMFQTGLWAALKNQNIFSVTQP
jgi:hypothetical protein